MKVRGTVWNTLKGGGTEKRRGGGGREKDSKKGGRGGEWVKRVGALKGGAGTHLRTMIIKISWNFPIKSLFSTMDIQNFCDSHRLNFISIDRRVVNNICFKDSVCCIFSKNIIKHAFYFNPKNSFFWYIFLQQNINQSETIEVTSYSCWNCMRFYFKYNLKNP